MTYNQGETTLRRPTSGEFPTNHEGTTLDSKAQDTSPSKAIVSIDVDKEGNLIVVEPEKKTIVSRKEAYDLIEDTANGVREQLKEIYERDRNQTNKWSYSSLTAAALGFLLICVGVAIAVLTRSVAAGILTLVASIIPEITAVLFFLQARKASKQSGNSLEKLFELERVYRAMELVSTVTSDSEMQDRLKETLVWRLLGLPPKGQEQPNTYAT